MHIWGSSAFADYCVVWFGDRGTWAPPEQKQNCGGMFDSADLRVVEVRRPEDERSPDAIDRYQRAVLRGLDRLEEESALFSGFHIGLISIAGLLMWIDWLSDNRGNQEDWRLHRPTLAAWYDAFVERPSYQRREELHPAESA